MSYFGLSKAEADKLPRKTGCGGFYKSLIYKYSIGSAVKGCVNKFGSVFNYLKKKMETSDTVDSSKIN